MNESKAPVSVCAVIAELYTSLKPASNNDPKVEVSLDSKNPN